MHQNQINNFSELLKEITSMKKEIIFLNNNIATKDIEYNNFIINKSLMIIDILDLIDTFDDEEHGSTSYVYIKKIKKKLLNILYSMDVEEITFPDNKISTGFVRIIEAQTSTEDSPGTIKVIVRKGYYIKGKNKVIRPADVISVK